MYKCWQSTCNNKNNLLDVLWFYFFFFIFEDSNLFESISSIFRNTLKKHILFCQSSKSTRDELDPITAEGAFEERENDATEDIIRLERIQKEEFAYNRQKKRRLIDENRCFFLFFSLSTSCSFFLPLLPLSHSFLSALFRSQNRSIRESDHKVANLYQENLSRYRGNLASRKRSVGLGKKLRWEKREVERRG